MEPKEVARSIDKLRKKIGGGKKEGAVYTGQGPGELSVENSAVALQQTVFGTLLNGDGGLLKMPVDQEVEGEWVTVADDLTSRRRELLVDLLHDHLPTYHTMQQDRDVRVFRISGKVNLVPSAQVTMTDWLRLIVREQGLANGYEDFAANALRTVTRRPSESWASAAARVLVVFRATQVDPSHPHITEPTFFWRHITARTMKALYERMVEVLLPNAIDRVGLSGLLHIEFAAVDRALEPLRTESHDPMNENMVARGVEALGLYDRFMHVLSMRTSSYEEPSASRKPTKGAGPDMLFSTNQLRSLFIQPQDLTNLTDLCPGMTIPALTATEPRSTKQEAADVARLAAFSNQTATTPGGHGVPFLTKPPRPSPPPPTASARPLFQLLRNRLCQRERRLRPTPPRQEIVAFLRDTRLCFAHAFAGCSRPNCRWSHDAVPAGFYSAASSRARPQRRLAALSPVQYELAAEMGLLESDVEDDNAAAAVAALAQPDK